MAKGSDCYSSYFLDAFDCNSIVGGPGDSRVFALGGHVLTDISTNDKQMTQKSTDSQ